MYYVPGTLLGARNTVGSKTEPDSTLLSTQFNRGGRRVSLLSTYTQNQERYRGGPGPSQCSLSLLLFQHLLWLILFWAMCIVGPDNCSDARLPPVSSGEGTQPPARLAIMLQVTAPLYSTFSSPRGWTAPQLAASEHPAAMSLC